MLLGDRGSSTDRTFVGPVGWAVDYEFRYRPVGVGIEMAGRRYPSLATCWGRSRAGSTGQNHLGRSRYQRGVPQIHEIGGVRPDPLPWHPTGLALDVIIPNPGTAEGIALGNQIVAFVLKNATRFGMQDAIWRGIYYTPNGPRGFGAGHYDHVHITTTGGGYPTGSETYVR